MTTSADWTPEQLVILEEKYNDLASFAEIARALDKGIADVKDKSDELGLRQNDLTSDEEAENYRLTILRFLVEHKRYLPNGWLVGLELGQFMTRSLVKQILKGDTWLEEIEEEIESFLEAIIQAHELTPVFSVGDMIVGADHGQAYRITGREFIPSDKRLTYYFTYLYGGSDMPEEYDDWGDEDEDGDDGGSESEAPSN